MKQAFITPFVNSFGVHCNTETQKNTGLDEQDFFEFLSVKLYIFSYPSVLTFFGGAQKNRLTETVLLSTHDICFG